MSDAQEWIGPEQKAALARHGYDPEAAASGVSGPPSTWEGFGYTPGTRVTLRPHVCELDGVTIDGHEGSDLDPVSTSCIHCEYEGPNP